MATIRHSLQRDVFEPTEERLVGVLYVTKPGKKKKTSFLCATINKEKPVYATIHQVLCFVSHLCFGRNNFNFCSFPKFFLIMALIPHSTFINSLLLSCSGRNLQCSLFIYYFCTIHTNSRLSSSSIPHSCNNLIQSFINHRLVYDVNGSLSATVASLYNMPEHCPNHPNHFSELCPFHYSISLTLVLTSLLMLSCPFKQHIFSK